MTIGDGYSRTSSGVWTGYDYSILLELEKMGRIVIVRGAWMTGLIPASNPPIVLLAAVNDSQWALEMVEKAFAAPVPEVIPRRPPRPGNLPVCLSLSSAISAAFDAVSALICWSLP